MENKSEIISVLNDLVAINNDRIVGYEKAIEEVKNSDIDLKAIFEFMKSNSVDHVKKLKDKIQSLGGIVENGTTLSGKIFRAWMDVKNTFTNHDRKSALESCVFGEKAAQNSYEMALESNADMDTEIRQLITTQKADLLSDYKKLEAYGKVNSALS